MKIFARMATAKYVPYAGFFNGGAITTRIEWFEDTSELVFLWVGGDGAHESLSFSEATNAGAARANGKEITVEPLNERSEAVFIYRSSALETEAEEQEDAVPLAAILKELGELRRTAEDLKVEASKAIRLPEWEGTESHVSRRAVRLGKALGFDALGDPV